MKLINGVLIHSGAVDMLRDLTAAGFTFTQRQRPVKRPVEGG
jgi:hypothetical protein